MDAYALEKDFPIIEPEKDVRREDWVEPYYQQLGERPGIAVILKCREWERIVVHFARSNQLEVQGRSVSQFRGPPHVGVEIGV